MIPRRWHVERFCKRGETGLPQGTGGDGFEIRVALGFLARKYKSCIHFRKRYQECEQFARAANVRVV